MTTRVTSIALLSVCVFLLPAKGTACACGCNVFTVGARWNMPTMPGMGLSLQYDYMNQGTNWGNWNSAPAESNSDQQIRTHFVTLGLRAMASRDWGFMLEAPVWNRYFRTLDDDGNIASAQHTSLGDVRVTGMYTGLSEDMSTGVQFGLKLPTGSFTESLLDRDTQIGTGTTDLLLGGYRMNQEEGWGWFAQVMLQHALDAREGYRPGDSFDAVLGVHYDGLLSSLPLVPMLQLAGSFRGIDSGTESDPDNTGYQRLYVVPGVEIVGANHFTIFADLKIPVMTHVRGVQLVAPALVNLMMGYSI